MNKTSSKHLREIITSLRDECIDLLPEEFHDRVADASKAYFEHRKNLNSELKRLKDAEHRASRLDKELAEQRKQYDEQQELLQSFERNCKSAEKALAASVKDHEDSLNSLKTTMLVTTGKAIIPLLSLIGDLYDQTRLRQCEYEMTTAAEERLPDHPGLTEAFNQIIAAAIAGYYLQHSTQHVVRVDELVVAVEQYELSSDFNVTVMTHDEAAELYDLKE